MIFKTKRFKVISIVIGIILIIIATIIYLATTHFKSLINKNTASLPKVMVGFPIQSLDAVPVMIAYQKNFFRDQGIDVSLMQLQSSEGALAVGSGKVDIDITGASRLFGPIEKGAPVKMLSLMSNMSSYLFIRPNSGITTLKDLEGKTVSLGPAGSQVLKFRYVLEKEGVDVNKIKFMDIDKVYLPMALMDKKAIDAALIDEPAYVDKAKEQGAIILPYWLEENYQKMPSGSSVSVNTDFLKNNVSSVNKFYKAMIQANSYLKDHLDESSVIATKYIKDNTNGAMDIKPEDFVKDVNSGAVSYILWQDVTPIVEMARINYELGLSNRILPSGDLYDLRFKGLLQPAQSKIYGAEAN